MQKINFFKVLALSGVFFFTSCSKNDDVVTETKSQTSNYVALVMTDQSNSSGFLIKSSTAMSGTVDVSKATSIKQVSEARNGGVVFGDAIYLGNAADAAAGVQKYTIDDAGQIKNSGFIASQTTGGYNCKVHVVSNTQGFYSDPVSGALKIQVFNPSVMQRTGEIDLSALSKKAINSDVKVEKAGDRMIASKDGKLYIDLQYDKNENGFGSSVYDAIYVAVVDLATLKYEKTITYKGAQEVSYPPNNLYMSLVDANGDLYINTMGNMGSADRNGKILRIKKGQTEFDTAFVIDINDYVKETGVKWFHGGGAVINGKVITGIKQSPFTSNYSNFNEGNIVFHTIDINTKVATPIAGMPKTDFVTICTPYYQDGKVMIPYSNAQGSGIYSYDGTTLKEEFKVASGVVSGYFKLVK